MGMKVNLRNVRVAWLNIFEKAQPSPQNKDEKPAYRIEILVDKDDHKNIAKLDEASFEVMKEAFKGSEKAAEKWLKRESGLEGNISKDCAIKDGDERDTEDENYEHKIWIRAKSFKQPRIQTNLAEDTTDGEENAETGDDLEGKVPYGGSYCNVSIELWGQNNDIGKGLRCNLLGLRFVEDGEAFGGGGSKERATDDDLGGDEDDAPRGRKSRRSSDDEDKPRGKSRRSRDDEDDEEEDRPRRSRRSRDEEDEEEDRPRRSRRSRDNEDDEEEEEEEERPRRRRR